MPVNLCLSIITDNYNNCNIITVSPQNVRGLKPFFLFCCLYLSQIPVCKHKTEPTFSVQMSHQPLKPVEVLLCTSLLSVYNSTSELCLINIGEEAVEDRWWIMRKKFRLWTDVHLGTQLWASAWENTASRQRRDSNPCSVSSASPLCLQPPEDGGEDLLTGLFWGSWDTHVKMLCQLASIRVMLAVVVEREVIYPMSKNYTEIY